VQGERDDKAFVAACIGEDFGLTPQQWRPQLERWAASCEPSFPLDELDRKQASAGRNRNQPAGYRLSGAPSTVGPQRGPEGLHHTTAWAAGVSLDQRTSAAAVAWAEHRGLDVQQLHARDLVRVLPPGACPS